MNISRMRELVGALVITSGMVFAADVTYTHEQRQLLKKVNDAIASSGDNLSAPSYRREKLDVLEQTVGYALAKGIHPNHIRYKKRPVLFDAVGISDEYLVELLLNYKADANSEYNNDHILFYAKKPSIIKLLIEHNADVQNATNKANEYWKNPTLENENQQGQPEQPVETAGCCIIS